MTAQSPLSLLPNGYAFMSLCGSGPNQYQGQKELLLLEVSENVLSGYAFTT
jgi:hypothetical protein